jgi:hypothetical protein
MGKGEMNLQGQKHKLHMELEPCRAIAPSRPLRCEQARRLFEEPPRQGVGSNTSWLHERFMELGDLMVGGE